jgi:tRNA(fMet)-specific endonuclease VapC
MRGHEGVASEVRAAERVVFSSVVAGELFYGFRCGARFEKNARQMRTFLERPLVTFLPVTLTTADRFGRIAAELRRKGTPIPLNDIWIAAHAMESGAELLSFDRHFELVPGLAWSLLTDRGG